MPGAGLFFNPLSLGRGLHRGIIVLYCPYGLVSLFKTLLLVGPALYDFCVMGPEAFWPAVYAWVTFYLIIFAFWVGAP
jgi:hypothetical protein